MAEPEPSEGVQRLNALPEADARALLTRCCGAARWVEAMLASRPFASSVALLAIANAVWQRMERADILEAFSHHPAIGSDLNELRAKFTATAAWSESEQAGASTASEATLLALRQGNLAYGERFGYLFIVCASGKSAREMLDLLNARLPHSSAEELPIAAAEQAKITRLRLEKI